MENIDKKKVASVGEVKVEPEIFSAKKIGMEVDEGRSRKYLQKMIASRRKATHFLENDNLSKNLQKRAIKAPAWYWYDSLFRHSL